MTAILGAKRTEAQFKDLFDRFDGQLTRFVPEFTGVGLNVRIAADFGSLSRRIVQEPDLIADFEPLEVGVREALKRDLEREFGLRRGGIDN